MGGATAPKTEPNSSKTTEAEKVLWETIKTSANPDDFRGYLTKYPNGKFESLARYRLNNLESAAREEATRKEQPKRKEEGVKKQEAGEKGEATDFDPSRKTILPLTVTDTSEGSHITIKSDAALNDYSAYRSGDRYYVVIPDANFPVTQRGLSGRGFDDVKVQKRGRDVVLSFRLQAGTNARISQRFDTLDVELTSARN